MKEKNFQSLFSDWAKNNKEHIKAKFGKCVAFELKLSKDKSIRFDDLREHQGVALGEVAGPGCFHKIADQPVSWGRDTKIRFTAKKPFDCFFMSEAPAFIVVWFYIKGQRSKDREMIFIRIEDWLKEWKIAEKEGRKSVREEYLRTIGIVEKMTV